MVGRGRPPIRVGTWGKITTKELGENRWRAHTRFRDDDGEVRHITRTGRTSDDAEATLKVALVARKRVAEDDDLKETTTVKRLGEMWLLGVQSSKRAPSTKARYASMVSTYINPALGALRLNEVSVGRVERFLVAVSERHGYSTAKTCRACLSSMLGMAVRHDVLSRNPVSGASDIASNPKPARALTPDETSTLMTALRADTLAVAHDLPDLVAFMLATGVRIGEALALQEAQANVDAGTVEILATVTDGGRQQRTKTDAGWRVLALPPAAVAMLRRRFADERIPTDVAVFPSPMGRVRDTSNTAAHMRRAFDRAGFPWLRSHGLRKTAATRLDDAGLTPRQIADQLGHARPSMTTDTYLGRRVTVKDAARVLDMPGIFSVD